MTTSETTVQRARQSLGVSQEAIYRMVRNAIEEFGLCGEKVVDVGCGEGRLQAFLCKHFRKYVGVDVIHYENFPVAGEFLETDLDTGAIRMADGAADVVVSVETIEHVENPRQFVRELARVTRPGGWVMLTTPNQLSLLSLLTLIARGQFSAFQSTDYPAHITALLEIDLKRIFRECGIAVSAVRYTNHGRMMMTRLHYPAGIVKLSPRHFSDNLMILGRRSGYPL